MATLNAKVLSSTAEKLYRFGDTFLRTEVSRELVLEMFPWIKEKQGSVLK